MNKLERKGAVLVMPMENRLKLSKKDDRVGYHKIHKFDREFEILGEHKTRHCIFVGIVSRYMEAPRTRHGAGVK